MRLASGIATLIMMAVPLAAACGSGASDSAQAPGPASPTDTDAGSDAAPAEVDGPVPARVQTIAAAFKTRLDCPGRIWQGYDWSKRQVLLVSATSKSAYLWNDQRRSTRGTTHTVDFASLPASVTGDFYFAPIDFQGPKTLAVSLDFTSGLDNQLKRQLYTDTAISITIHEGFHLWGQEAWLDTTGVGVPDEVSERDPSYPDNWRLRYLRSQVLSATRASLDAAAPLGDVAHWQNLLKTELASDLTKLRSSDVLEGTAQYTTTIATVVAKLGCNASPASVLAEIRTNAEKMFLSLDEPLQAGSESYDLGLAALLLLQQSAPLDAKIAAGETPVDALVSGVAASDVADDPKVLADVQSSVEARNAAAAMWIDPLIARLKDPAATRLALPTSWIDGAFSLYGAYYDTNEANVPHVTSSLSAALTDPKSKTKVVLTRVDVVDEVTTPCGTGMTVVPVDAASITLAADHTSASAKTSTLDFAALPVKVMTDGAGLAWLCPVL